MDVLLNFFKALSDETRLRILVLLYKQAFCVCELTEILGLTQPKVSKHLSKLKDLGFVKTKRDQLYIYYHLALEDEQLLAILKHIQDHLSLYPQLLKDDHTLAHCTLINR